MVYSSETQTIPGKHEAEVTETACLPDCIQPTNYTFMTFTYISRYHSPLQCHYTVKANINAVMPGQQRSLRAIRLRLPLQLFLKTVTLIFAFIIIVIRIIIK